MLSCRARLSPSEPAHGDGPTYVPPERSPASWRTCPGARALLDALGIEGSDVVPRGIAVHVTHQDVRGMAGFCHDEKCGEAEAVLRDLRDAERGGAGGFVKPTESSVGRHGPRREPIVLTSL